VITGRSSLLRDAVGFGVGGLSAAVTAGASLMMICPIPPDQPGRPNYAPVALAVVVILSFLCGGFVGRRAFSADFWSELLPSVLTSYGVMFFLALISSLDLSEAAPIIGFVSVGLLASTILLLSLGRRFPQTPNTHEI
jgi:hypothetical protein